MSDRLGRKPTTTVVRHPADWFADHCYIASFLNAVPNPVNQSQFFTAALFNDDASGRVLRVYGVSVVEDGGAGLQLFFVQRPLGSPGGSVSALRPDRGVEAGQLYIQDTTIGPPFVNPYFSGPPIATIGSSGFDSASHFSPFPLFIVPAGYSLVGTNLAPNGFCGVSFWYQVAAQ